MKFYKNRKIETKLKITFTSICIVIFVISGILISFTGIMSHKTEQLINEPFRMRQTMQKMDNSIEKIEKFILYLAMAGNKEEVNQYLSQINEEVESVLKDFVQMKNYWEKTEEIEELEKDFSVIREVIEESKEYLSDDLPKEQVIEYMKIYQGFQEKINEKTEKLKESAQQIIDTHKSEINWMSKFSLVFTSFVCIALVVIIILLAKNIIKSIVIPLQQEKKVLQKIASGKLKEISEEDLNYEKEDEFGKLMEIVKDTVCELSTYIFDITDKLTKVKELDLSSYIDREYRGDFTNIKASINYLVGQLIEIVSRITVTSDQVKEGAEQLAIAAENSATTANNLSENTKSIEENTKEMAENIYTKAEQAQDVKKNVEHIEIGTQNCEESIFTTSKTMKKIKSQSEEMIKFLSGINDINDEVALLALNAEIEAARAGQEGRGFAVVAKQMQTLAVKTQEISEQIGKSLNEVEYSVTNGDIAIQNVIRSFQGMKEDLEKSIPEIGDILECYENMKESIGNLKKEVDSIAEGNKENVDNSQQNAATAQQLLAQTEELNSIIAQFTV